MRKLITSSESFKWYKKSIDAKQEYLHDHEGGEPERFPCVVDSYIYEPSYDAPYTVNHAFFYKDKNTCETCNHTQDGWPENIREWIDSGEKFED